ncbi:oxidoreductase domain-containing protein [Hypoxylon trugodes]|uniref:oxidoreductase domain-containing protein n=1 Tax=Hypoxylon trugodes TaxID=326681 RepID=UPI00218DF26B|nr:oxidoreductase domain-containing protein [Hypoxylon trugodes]KAI1388994.1 oxidoreductase domain-containing protein [Hypoxylon trugodes]
MAFLLDSARRNWQLFYPSDVRKSPAPLRFGILGAANIAANALITPAKTHPEVIVQVVAARDLLKAKAFAQKHRIPEVARTYQDILNNPNINAVYIPLPNGLHYEWAFRALAAGKHVLLEKPSVNNSREAEALFNSPLLDGPQAPVLLEAAHFVFHPAWAAFMSYVKPYHVSSAKAVQFAPKLMFGKNNIRYRYDLGGGALMDLGVYGASVLARIFATIPELCEECVTQPSSSDPRCDRQFKARYRFPGGRYGVMEGDLNSFEIKPEILVVHNPIIVSGEEAGIELSPGLEVVRIRKVRFSVYLQPSYLHYIQVDDDFKIRGIEDPTKRVIKSWSVCKAVKAYTFRDIGIDQPGEPDWSTYRYQLEQFVNKIRNREVQQWVDGADSINAMKMVDMAYTKAKLPLRPMSEYTLPPEA